MVIIPRVGKADVPSLRAEPVARLKAMAAHHGLPVFDLSDTFDQIDPAKLEIAAWDDHPNAIGPSPAVPGAGPCAGQGPGAVSLAVLSRRERPRPAAVRAGRRSAASVTGRGELASACGKSLPRLDKIVVCDQDDAFAHNER